MASGDTCVSIGAAFENLEVEGDREKVKKKRDAAFYVKDKQGRRRFHGAFTGGFSAGYYNTVGTEEGNCSPYLHGNVLVIILQDGLHLCSFHHVLRKLTVTPESLRILWMKR